VVLSNLVSKSETCVGSCVHLVGASISFKKNFCWLPFTPPSLVLRIGPSPKNLGSSRSNSRVFVVKVILDRSLDGHLNSFEKRSDDGLRTRVVPASLRTVAAEA
jgi:hypothetical protein